MKETRGIIFFCSGHFSQPSHQPQITLREKVDIVDVVAIA